MKIIIYILCIFILTFSTAFASAERFNTLSNIQIDKQSYSGVKLKLYTSQSYNQQITPKRIDKYTYLITLPGTKSSVNMNSEFFQKNRNITVKTIQSGNSAYTKIIVNMPVTIPLSLNFAISNSGAANKRSVYKVNAASISMQSINPEPVYQTNKSIKSINKNVKYKENSQIRNSSPAKITNASINIKQETPVSQQNQRVYNRNSNKVSNHVAAKQQHNMPSYKGAYIIAILLSCLATFLFFRQNRKIFKTNKSNKLISTPTNVKLQEVSKIVVQSDIQKVDSNKTIDFKEIPNLGMLYDEFKNKNQDY